MKGPRGQEELQQAAKGIARLSGVVLNVDSYQLADQQQRLVIDLTKDQPTNRKYPRNYSQIKKKPL
jgi:16S rRNA (guanine527-N7)-methyltransferase